MKLKMEMGNMTATRPKSRTQPKFTNGTSTQRENYKLVNLTLMLVILIFVYCTDSLLAVNNTNPIRNLYCMILNNGNIKQWRIPGYINVHTPFLKCSFMLN